MFSHIFWVLDELKFLIFLALPPSIIYLTEGLQMKLSNLFIGRTSGGDVSSALSGLFIGQVFITCTSYTITEGLSLCANILCSQAYGAKQYRLVGLYYYRVLLLMLLTCFPVFTLLISTGPIVYHISHDWELSLNAGTYTTFLCFAYPAYAYYKISLRFLLSQNIVWGPLVYLLVGNMVNAILQYILICHYLLGVSGAAASYVISIYIIALLVYGQIRFSRVHILTAVSVRAELLSGWFQIAKYVIPSMIQTSISTTITNVYPIILILIISHSKTQLAIYSIMYSVWWVVSLLSMGYATSLTVRVSQLLGADEFRKAKISAILGIVFGQAGLLIICIGTMLLSKPLSHLFTTDARFANELYHNLFALPLLILSDILSFGQGIMNACGMQQTQATLKFIFVLIIGSSTEFFLVKLVTWKALCLFSVQCCVRFICFALCMIILFTRNWSKLSHKIRTDHHINDNEIPDVTVNCRDNDPSQPRWIERYIPYLMFLAYLFYLLIGVSIFITVYVFAS